MKGEPAQMSIHDKGQKGEPGLDGIQGLYLQKKKNKGHILINYV